MSSTRRQQMCLPQPAASVEGKLYVSDVVYSQVHRQLVLFGPTRKPLGGLYCERDGNPQTSKTARKVCHPNRVAEELQRAWIWARPLVSNIISLLSHNEVRGHMFNEKTFFTAVSLPVSFCSYALPLGSLACPLTCSLSLPSPTLCLEVGPCPPPASSRCLLRPNPRARRCVPS